MVNESKSFGTRPAGTPVRKRLINLHHMNEGEKVLIDFKDIEIISSSFADEVFGKLFYEIGPIEFMKIFEFLNISPIIEKLMAKMQSYKR